MRHAAFAIRPLAGKALRMLLVFLLVFYGTYQVEYALADDPDASASSSASGAGGKSGGKPDDGKKQEEPASSSSAGSQQGGGSGQAGGSSGSSSGTAASGSSSGGTSPSPSSSSSGAALIAGHEAGSLVGLAVYEAPSREGEDFGARVRPFAHKKEKGKGDDQTKTVEVREVKGSIQFLAGALWQGNSKPENAADLVEWSVDKEKIATIDKKTGKLTATGAGNDTVKVTCKLKDGYAKLAGGELAARAAQDDTVGLSAVFNVEVLEQGGIYVTGITIVTPDGAECREGDVLRLSDDEMASYQLAAIVRARDPAAGDGTGEDLEFKVGPAEGLARASGGGLSDLTWRADEAKGASIDAKGLFKGQPGGRAVIRCSSEDGHEGDAFTASIVIQSESYQDDAQADQGAHDPQPALEVAVNVLGAGSGEDGDGAGGGGDGAGSAGPYILDDSTGLSPGTATYTPYSAAAGRFVPITGTGPYLADVLRDAGIDTSQIESIDFESADGSTTKLTWSQLTGTYTYEADAGGDYGDARTPASPLLAVRSYVHSANEAGPVQESQLLDNTRYRLLLGATAPGSDTLGLCACSIKRMTVNIIPSLDEEADDSLRAWVNYVPVKKDKVAVFTYGVSGLYEDDEFGLSWEESSDGGASWHALEDFRDIQTLERLTSDEYLGNRYRIVVETTDGRRAVSAAETLREGSGFSVNLEYHPPLAGQMALFSATVNDAGSATVEYTWEVSNDGGKSWSVIPGARGQTFSTQTRKTSGSSPDSPDAQPAPEADGGEGEGDGPSADAPEPGRKSVQMQYVRVRAKASDGREAISVAQPVTVRTDDSGGSSGAPGAGSEDARQTGDQTDPESESEEAVEAPAEEGAAEASAEEAEAPAQPDGARAQAAGASTPAAAPSSAATPRRTAPQVRELDIDLAVDPEVSEAIAEQQEARAAKQPGVRWSELSLVNPAGEEVQRLLARNPFAPFVLPFCLGLLAAGALERFLAFRRETRPSAVAFP